MGLGRSLIADDKGTCADRQLLELVWFGVNHWQQRHKREPATPVRLSNTVLVILGGGFKPFLVDASPSPWQYCAHAKTISALEIVSRVLHLILSLMCLARSY
jgi:hypothetical protein